VPVTLPVRHPKPPVAGLLVTRGVAIVDLAREMRYSTNHLRAVIAGKRTPTPRLRRELADALGVDEGSLFDQ
jgi:hypothetical protein